MKETTIICDRDFAVGEIDERMYGSFLEHMGRVIYSGIYEPENQSADEDGFRTDVLQAVKEMGVTAVRYPGGNFVSTYRWEDGTGPKELRPKKLEIAWRSIETNEFGTNEFMKWAGKANVQPMLTVNLSTRGIADAVNYLEYCNFPAGTLYSELRKSHGIVNPYHVSMWCLGNEMDGPWQVGHKTAYEYGRLAAETGRAMKQLDPDIELIACGSSLSSMDTCPAWDMEVLEQTCEVIDYLSLHQYYGGQEKGTGEFLAQALDMEEYIQTLRSAVNVIRQKKHLKKKIRFSIDEWGVWAAPGNLAVPERADRSWEIAPSISEQVYTLEDALLFAQMQMAMLKNADVVKIACQSLLTNISSCIMTERNGGLWLQSTYYPFYCFANYAKGTVLQSQTRGETYDTEKYAAVPFINNVTVWNGKAGELAVFLVNRSEDEWIRARLSLRGFHVKGVKEFCTLSAKDKHLTNQVDHQAVVPIKRTDAAFTEDTCVVELQPLSFHMVLLAV